MQVSPFGLGIAVVAVLSSALQQILCGAMQRKHLVSSHQLLGNTAHIQVRRSAAAAPYCERHLCSSPSASLLGPHLPASWQSHQHHGICT